MSASLAPKVSFPEARRTDQGPTAVIRGRLASPPILLEKLENAHTANMTEGRDGTMPHRAPTVPWAQNGHSEVTSAVFRMLKQRSRLGIHESC